MKSFLQALGLMATALLFTAGCEDLTEAEVPTEKIVYLGKIIYKPKYASFSAPTAIHDSTSTNKIWSVQIDFENERIHYYGKTNTDAKCYFDRVMTPTEILSMTEPMIDLEFCELQTKIPVACLALFMPTDSIYIYDYRKLHYVDEYPSYCDTNHPQLCVGADAKPIFATIKALAIQDLVNCQ